MPKKVSLLIRELRNDKGDLIPIKEEIRQLLLFLEREANVSFKIEYYPMARLVNQVKMTMASALVFQKTANA